MYAAGHKELPLKGDLNLTVFGQGEYSFLYQIHYLGILLRVRMELFIW